ncbi:Uncharacterised protein [Mycobacteroides abscessus subsp. abscessus]|nr:Uncharacterised protein [Mycobacteroides abscessus subsp. abscessus]
MRKWLRARPECDRAVDTSVIGDVSEGGQQVGDLCGMRPFGDAQCSVGVDERLNAYARYCGLQQSGQNGFALFA